MTRTIVGDIAITGVTRSFSLPVIKPVVGEGQSHPGRLVSAGESGSTPRTVGVPQGHYFGLGRTVKILQGFKPRA